MKNTILLFLLIFSFQFMNAQYTEKPFVAVQGSATEYAIPNEILISFTVHERSDNLITARQQGSQKVREAVEFLKNQGVAEKHIQTQYQNIGTRMKNHDSNEVNFYEFRQSLNVCITNLKTYDTIIDGLINIGIFNVGSPNFRTTELEKIEKEVHKKAVKDAKAKAEMLANELGQSIGKALQISDIGRNNGENGPAAYMRSSAMESSNAPSFAGGQIEISKTITIYFELLEQ